MLAAVNERTRLVALCNPNDPTGELLSTGTLRALLEALPERVVVLLDEALRDFVDAEERDATLALLEDHPRLLVFRTFSKAWGLAGLRCGYAIGGPGADPLLEQLAPELGLNELAQAGALEALRSGEALVAGRAAGVAAERRRLMAELDRARSRRDAAARRTCCGCGPTGWTAPRSPTACSATASSSSPAARWATPRTCASPCAIARRATASSER